MSHFTICAAIATQIPMAQLVRPEQPFCLAEMVTRLEQAWAAAEGQAFCTYKEPER